MQSLQSRLYVCIALIASFWCTSVVGACKVLTDFDGDTGDIRWRTVNDGVMGGRSRGDHRVTKGLLVFRGATNTNGGGFSSIRSVRQRLNLAGEGLTLRLRGDGRTYTFRLSSRTQRATWWADFSTSGEWETVFVPFSDFSPRWRGMRLNGPDLRPELADGLGLMIYDKRDGPFALDVDSISNCAGKLDTPRPDWRAALRTRLRYT